MASDLREQLTTLSLDELKELAASRKVDTGSCESKEDFVEVLAKNGVAPKPPSLERLLSVMKLKDLRDLAARHALDVSKLRKKKEIAEALVTSPRAQSIYDEVRPELEAVAAIPTPTRKLPPLDDADADLLLYASKNAEVDLGRSEDLLDQARMRFEERNFERSIGAADEAANLIRANAESLQRSAWAYTILSCQRLIEDCGKAGREVDDAAFLLLQVKTAFRTNSLGSQPDLLAKLQEVSRNLYSQEIQRSRAEIYRVQEILGNAANMGANVVAPDEALNRARDALRRNDPLTALQVAAEAERLTNETRKARIKEIEDAIPFTASIITEARNVGADVGEAERWLDKARVAATGREHVLAGELVKRAERAAMQSQHHQIEKAMELRRRQVEKAQSVIVAVEPLIDEAYRFDIDVTEAQTLLRQARDVLAKGDYVNGTVYAKNAAEVARRLEPKVVEERAKRGIVKPDTGVCGKCGSKTLSFADDGTGKCSDCGHEFRWRVPAGRWERFVSSLRD
ncbi:MAG TPA: hypothetical protein VK723_06535 [Thermoplasmata archaeon]|nr:hypothetical protein [Thermoplasmata archaeon]